MNIFKRLFFSNTSDPQTPGSPQSGRAGLSSGPQTLGRQSSRTNYNNNPTTTNNASFADARNSLSSPLFGTQTNVPASGNGSDELSDVSLTADLFEEDRKACADYVYLGEEIKFEIPIDDEGDDVQSSRSSSIDEQGGSRWGWLSGRRISRGKRETGGSNSSTSSKNVVPLQKKYLDAHERNMRRDFRQRMSHFRAETEPQMVEFLAVGGPTPTMRLVPPPEAILVDVCPEYAEEFGVKGDKQEAPGTPHTTLANDAMCRVLTKCGRTFLYTAQVNSSYLDPNHWPVHSGEPTAQESLDFQDLNESLRKLKETERAGGENDEEKKEHEGDKEGKRPRENTDDAVKTTSEDSLSPAPQGPIRGFDKLEYWDPEKYLEPDSPEWDQKAREVRTYRRLVQRHYYATELDLAHDGDFSDMYNYSDFSSRMGGRLGRGPSGPNGPKSRSSSTHQRVKGQA